VTCSGLSYDDALVRFQRDKNIRCPYCGDESRATSGWVRSRMAFQCGGCGEKVSLHETKIRKVFDAVRRRLGGMTGG